LFGDNGANVLSGCGGADVILGFGGPDTLVGDTRNVPFGNDTLNGGDGNDILNGGKGGDSLTGGAGADTFVWNSAEESAGVSIPLGGIDVANTDVILDFNRAEGDVIDLQNVDANDPLPGFQQGFNFIGEYWAHGGFTAPGQVAYALDGTGNTYLFFNTNYVYTTSDIADFEFGIRLVGQYTPNADWLNYGLGFQ
jgi:Ca2+-binding RTX toxin-like protein